MAVTVDPNKVLTGPGILYAAPLGTAEPTNTVVGGVFTDLFTAVSGWVALGPTDAGTTLSNQVSTDNVEVAEQLTPVKIVTTGRADSIAFALAHYTLSNYKVALNGGTITTTGTAGTTLNAYTPPQLGAEVRTMVGWQSDDSTVRAICYQCFQSGSVAPQFNKGANKALLACTFSMETPSTGIAFKIFTAGVNRG